MYYKPHRLEDTMLVLKFFEGRWDWFDENKEFSKFLLAINTGDTVIVF